MLIKKRLLLYVSGKFGMIETRLFLKDAADIWIELLARVFSFS